MKERYERLFTKYFTLDKNSPDYSEEYSHVIATLDHETREITTVFYSRYNSSYNHETIVKI